MLRLLSSGLRDSGPATLGAPLRLQGIGLQPWEELSLFGLWGVEAWILGIGLMFKVLQRFVNKAYRASPERIQGFEIWCVCVCT